MSIATQKQVSKLEKGKERGREHALFLRPERLLQLFGIVLVRFDRQLLACTSVVDEDVEMLLVLSVRVCQSLDALFAGHVAHQSGRARKNSRRETMLLAKATCHSPLGSLARARTHGMTFPCLAVAGASFSFCLFSKSSVTVLSFSSLLPTT